MARIRLKPWEPTGTHEDYDEREKMRRQKMLEWLQEELGGGPDWNLVQTQTFVDNVQTTAPRGGVPDMHVAITKIEYKRIRALFLRRKVRGYDVIEYAMLRCRLPEEKRGSLENLLDRASSKKPN